MSITASICDTYCICVLFIYYFHVILVLDGGFLLGARSSYFAYVYNELSYKAIWQDDFFSEMKEDDWDRGYQCPCYRNNTECPAGFEKVLDLKNAGLVIYRHLMQPDNEGEDGKTAKGEGVDENVFIFQNNNNADIASVDFLAEIEKKAIKCPRCRQIMDQALHILQKVTAICKNEVIGICDHCKLKQEPCCGCVDALKEFYKYKKDVQENMFTKKRVQEWLTKVQTVFKDYSADRKEIRRGKVNDNFKFHERLRARSVVRIDQISHQKNGQSRRELSIGEMYLQTQKTSLTRRLTDTDRTKKQLVFKFDDELKVVEVEDSTEFAFQRKSKSAAEETYFSKPSLKRRDYDQDDLLPTGYPKKYNHDRENQTGQTEKRKDKMVDIDEKELSEHRVSAEKDYFKLLVKKSEDDKLGKNFIFTFPREIIRHEEYKRQKSSSELIHDVQDRIRKKNEEIDKRNEETRLKKIELDKMKQLTRERKAKQNEEHIKRIVKTEMTSDSEIKKTTLQVDKSYSPKSPESSVKKSIKVKQTKSEPNIKSKSDESTKELKSHVKSSDLQLKAKDEINKIDQSKLVKKQPKTKSDSNAEQQREEKQEKSESKVQKANSKAERIPQKPKTKSSATKLKVDKPKQPKVESKQPKTGVNVEPKKPKYETKLASKQPETEQNNPEIESKSTKSELKPPKPETKQPKSELTAQLKQQKVDSKQPTGELNDTIDAKKQADSKKPTTESIDTTEKQTDSNQRKAELIEKTGPKKEVESKQPKAESKDKTESKQQTESIQPKITAESKKDADSKKDTDSKQLKAETKDTTESKKQTESKQPKTDSKETSDLKKLKTVPTKTETGPKMAPTEFKEIKDESQEPKFELKGSKTEPKQLKVESIEPKSELKDYKAKSGLKDRTPNADSRKDHDAAKVKKDSEKIEKEKDKKDTKNTKKGKEVDESSKLEIDLSKIQKDLQKTGKGKNNSDNMGPTLTSSNPVKIEESSVIKHGKDIKQRNQFETRVPRRQIEEQQQSPEPKLKKPKKEIEISHIRMLGPSQNRLFLDLVSVKENKMKKKTLSQLMTPSQIQLHVDKHKTLKTVECLMCVHSNLELEYESRKKEREHMAELIRGLRIRRLPYKEEKAEELVKPLLFQIRYDDQFKADMIKAPKYTSIKARVHPEDEVKPIKVLPEEIAKGPIRYALSDRSFIEKGWTVLPTEKVVRKMNVYRMRPAHPEFDWFKRNKGRRVMTYDTGERLAEFDDDGRGRWYYKNQRLALQYYDAEELNAQQRFVIFSNGEPDERGRARPYTILATFDYLGNGVVFDHGGKIRMKYNQTEGVLLDRNIGPTSHWKWHSLNDPPVLQQVMIDTQATLKDPQILKMGPPDKKERPDNEDMLAIEFDNFIKEKSKKLSQHFKPFQIKMKALKINEQFSLKVLDQANVHLTFRDGTTHIKLNLGMLLDHKEIVDTDTAELGEVSNTMEKFPARTDSLAAMQKSIAFARHFERSRTERERRLRPPAPSASADLLVAATGRGLQPPLRAASSSPTSCFTLTTTSVRRSRKPSSSNVYYDSRLL